MRIIGALAFGIMFFFGSGLAMGKTPRLYFGLGRSKPKADVSNRQLWLTQAGLELSPTQYYAGLFAFSAIVFAVVSAITATPVVALAPAAIAGVLPHVFFSRKRDKNVSKTTKAWPDAIREVISSIESNASLHGALTQLAYKGPDELREAFDRFPTLSTTVGVVPALESVRERLGDPTSDRVIEILILAHERGGAVITEILRDLARATTEDLQLVEEIETSQLEQKINSRAVFALPWLVLIMLVMSNNNFRRFYQTGTGFAVVIAGALLSATGMLIMAKLSKSEPEARVFGGSALSPRNHAAEVEEVSA
jgi:tight adherence protein B